MSPSKDARVVVDLRGWPSAAGVDGGRRHPRPRRQLPAQEIQHASGQKGDASQDQRGRVPGGALQPLRVGAGHLPEAAARRPPARRPQAALALPKSAKAGHQQPHKAVEM